MANLKFFYGVQSKYDSLLSKGTDLYFIEDTRRLYRGEQLIADANVEFTTTQPSIDNVVDGRLYIYTNESGETSIWAKSGDAVVQVGGGEAKEIADGIITISKFNPAAVSSSIPDDASTASDSKVVTEKAVADALSAIKTSLGNAYVNVEATRAVDKKSTVLKFTNVDGGTKEVTVADLFLTSATYDASTHILTLVVNDSNVEVDLSDLVGNSFSDVKIDADEAFTVELGAGGTLGGYKTGDTIPKDTSLETVVKKLLMKQVPPTYTQPSVSIANNSGTAAGSYEYGTNVTPKIKATFNKADAGNLTSIQFKKDGTNVGDSSASSPATYSEAEFSLTASVSYSATATYAEGDIKNDNLGQPYPTGHIAAGSKNSSNFTYTPFRNVFYGGTTTKPTLDSAYIRSLTAKGSAYSKNAVLNFTVPEGCQRVVVAFQTTASSNKPKFETTTGLTLDVSSSFESQSVNVNGANDSTAVAYTVWMYEPAAAYAVATTFKVTLN